MNVLRTLLAGLACATPLLGLAQWQWIDKDGRKVFSDQSPPPDIPAKSILRQPGGRAAAPAPALEAASAPAAGTRTAANTPKVSGKDKELEEKRRQAEAAEAERKKAEEDQLARQRADNCERARQGKATFDSGQRVSRVNAKGEREIMDDAQRAAEVKRLQEVIKSDCKAS